MRLHTYDFGYTFPCILTEEGIYSSYHLTPEGLQGEPVTDDTATHFVVIEALISNPRTMERQLIGIEVRKNDFQQN